MGRRGDSPISSAQGRTLAPYPGVLFLLLNILGSPLSLSQKTSPLRPDPPHVNIVPLPELKLSYRGALYPKFSSSLAIISSLTPTPLPAVFQGLSCHNPSVGP